MLHEIKIKMSYADAILEGRKNFEVRVNDRGFNAGDEVQYTVVEDNGTFTEDARIHDLNKKRYVITYVQSGLGLKEEYVVFGIRKVKKEGDAWKDRQHLKL